MQVTILLVLDTVNPQDRDVLTAVSNIVGGVVISPVLAPDPYEEEPSEKPAAKAKKPAAKAKKPAAKAKPAAEKETTPAVKVSLTDVRDRFTKFVSKEGTDAAVKILAQFEADRVSDLKSDQYPGFLAALIDFEG